jgi:protein tyrosine/serine phosphatase
MRNTIKSHTAVALFIAVALLSSTGFGETQSHYKELPNFYVVNEHLYRGGQPGPGGIKKLGDLGVKAIVNLRGEDDVSRAEEREAAAAHIRYFKVPMAGIGRPTDAEISKVMAIIDNSENWPVFIHCKHGCDRTGTVVACYRISHDNWDGDRATAEAKKFGMSWIEVGMRGYIADFYRSHPHINAKPAVNANPAASSGQAKAATPNSGTK